MKQFLLLLIAAAFIFSTPLSSFSQTLVTVTAVDSDAEYLIVTRPLGGIMFWHLNQDTIYAGDDGSYQFTYDPETPELIFLRLGRSSAKLVLVPGKSCQVNFAAGESTFKGDYAKGMTAFNQWPRPYFHVGESRKFENDSTAEMITGKIDAMKSYEINELFELLSFGYIDSSVYQLLKNEIDYFYADRIAKIITVRSYSTVPLNPDLEELMERTLTNYPVEAAIFPPNWESYLETVILDYGRYRKVKAGELEKDDIGRMYKEDELHPYHAKLMLEYLEGEYLGKFFAWYIIHSAKQEHFEASLPGVFDTFKDKYPDSRYMSFLEPEIKVIREYHQKIKADLSDKVTIIPGEDINTFEELLEQFKGRKLYVDLWATWCGPCKREFRYNEAAGAVLEKYGYEKLYISIDRAELEQKWIDDIKFFELNGTHLLANKDFQTSFAGKYTLEKGMFAIPQYLLVDENGVIITNNAPRPGKSEDLEELLKQH